MLGAQRLAGEGPVSDVKAVDTGRGDAVAGLDLPAYSTGWTARRLGVAAATLRTWHRRYDVGPTGRTEGGHRRYVLRDLDRLP